MSTVDLSGLVWRKSNRSTVNGDNGNCVEIAWRKSSRSSSEGDNANCVEVAITGLDVAVRDSKNPGAAILSFPAAAFASVLRAGRPSG